MRYADGQIILIENNSKKLLSNLFLSEEIEIQKPKMRSFFPKILENGLYNDDVNFPALRAEIQFTLFDGRESWRYGSEFAPGQS